MPARTALLLGCTAAALRSGRPPPAQKKPWKPQLLDAEPAPAPPRVLHRDADVVVVDKPPGWSVDAAAAFVADLLGAEPRVRQRLDADCSGVLCLGASAAGDAALRDAAPSYLALVDDEPARAAAARGACSIIESGPAGAVVRVAGRDVRKSLAAAGAPARGDARHGCGVDRAAPRALVHCERVELRGTSAERPTSNVDTRGSSWAPRL